ncbi:MAG: hypothetical protein Q8K32_31355 [Archangium sp.]|nr:hypothetical protein [Archangium sp.]
MANVAHLRKVYVRTDNTAPTGPDELDGAKDCSIDRTRDVLDNTDFKAGDTRTKQMGLKDASGNISGDWEPTDTIQTILRTAHENGTLAYVTVLNDGVNGFTYPMFVSDISEGGGVADLVSADFTLTQSGAPTARP